MLLLRRHRVPCRTAQQQPRQQQRQQRQRQQRGASARHGGEGSGEKRSRVGTSRLAWRRRAPPTRRAVQPAAHGEQQAAIATGRGAAGAVVAGAQGGDGREGSACGTEGVVDGDATGADLWPAITRSAVVVAALSVAAAVPLVGFLAAPAATRSVLWSSRGTEGRRETSVAQARPVVQTAEDCERRTVISNKR